jgi:hypothetical protein
MESIASHEDFGIDQKGLLKQESGENVLDLVHYPVKTPGQSTELYNDEHDGTKSTKRMQDEGCEYDFYQRDSRAHVKTHIWASPTSVAAPKSQILIEQSIFQYFVHADTVDEGFWDGNDDSDQFLKQYTLQPLFDEHDFKLEGKYGGVGKLGGLTNDDPNHEITEVNTEIEKISLELFESVGGTPDWASKCRLSGDDVGGYCSNRTSCTGSTDPDISETDESDSQASFYQNLSGTIGREAEGLGQSSRPILDRERRRLVDRVMEEFWGIFGDTLFADSESPVGSGSLVDGDQVSRNCSHAAGIASASSSSLDDQSTPSGEQKRKRDDEQEENDNGNNQKKQNPPDRSILPSAGVHTVRFACPFRKHNPRVYNMYKHRSCALSGWNTIARIKYHIWLHYQSAAY